MGHHLHVKQPSHVCVSGPEGSPWGFNPVSLGTHHCGIWAHSFSERIAEMSVVAALCWMC